MLTVVTFVNTATGPYVQDMGMDSTQRLRIIFQCSYLTRFVGIIIRSGFTVRISAFLALIDPGNARGWKVPR